jgi:hypothetical protein
VAHFYYFTPNKRGVLSCRNLQNPNLTLLSDPSFGNSSSPTSQRKTVSLQHHTENSKVHVYSTIASPPLPRHAKVVARLSNGYEAPNPFLVRERLTSHAARLRRLIIINSRPEPACTFQTRAWPIKSIVLVHLMIVACNHALASENPPNPLVPLNPPRRSRCRLGQCTLM